MGKKTMNGEARGRDIHDGKERTLAKLQPTQLALFQVFVPEDDKYSNTIELYDAIPKYFTNKRQMAEIREGPEGREIYLPTLEREFKHHDVISKISIIHLQAIYGPARAVKGLSHGQTRFGTDAVIYPASW